jgi:hypothetical protein
MHIYRKATKCVYCFPKITTRDLLNQTIQSVNTCIYLLQCCKTINCFFFFPKYLRLDKLLNTMYKLLNTMYKLLNTMYKLLYKCFGGIFKCTDNKMINKKIQHCIVERVKIDTPYTQLLDRSFWRVRIFCFRHSLKKKKYIKKSIQTFADIIYHFFQQVL